MAKAEGSGIVPAHPAEFNGLVRDLLSTRPARELKKAAGPTEGHAKKRN